MRTHPHARWRRRAIAMDMGQQAWPGIEPHGTKPQREALAVVNFIRMMQHCVGDQFAPGGDLAPFETVRKALYASRARRILNCAAIEARLQLESALGRGGREPQRGATARMRRQRQQALRTNRVAWRGPFEGLRHARPRMAAPLVPDNEEEKTLLSRCQDSSTAAQPAFVVDHAEPACKPNARAPNRGTDGLPGYLADDLDQPQKAAGGTGLTH